MTSLHSLCFILILCTLSLVHINYAQTCEDNNGGCSHICLYRGPEKGRQCACPCLYTLEPDEKTCMPRNPCKLDIYVLLDKTQSTDSTSCHMFALFGSGFGDFNKWKNWRDNVTRVLKMFAADNDTDHSYGIQTFSEQHNPDTLLLYNDTDITSAITKWENMSMPNCAYDSDFSKSLLMAVEMVREIGNHEFKGPGARQPWPYATSVAMIFAYPAQVQPQGMTAFERNIDLSKKLMDHVLMINLSEDVADLSQQQKESRYAACGNTSVPCDKVFNLTAENEFNKNVTLENLLSVINPDACLSRQYAPTLIQKQCGSTMQVNIPKCVLNGLNITDLMFNDASCDLSEMTTETDLYYQITVPFTLCGRKMKEVKIGQGTFTRVTQNISTRAFHSNQNLIDFNYEMICDFPVVIPSKKTKYRMNANNTDALPQYNVSLTAYNSSLYDIPLASSQQVLTNSTVYIEATSDDLRSQFNLKFSSCIATSASNASYQHVLLENGCPVDATVKILSSSQFNITRASFSMFEFTPSYSQQDQHKSLITIKCQLTACLQQDVTSSRCNPSCSNQGRRKRSVAEESLNWSESEPFYLLDHRFDGHRAQYAISRDHAITRDTVDNSENEQSISLVENIALLLILSIATYYASVWIVASKYKKCQHCQES